nr:hypothetical protein [Chloroflexaceae bacterium]
NAISKPVYDQRSGELREPELVVPTGLVIAHGLHTLASPALIDLFDLTLYLEPDEQLRHAWQTQRDVAQQRATARQLEAQHSQHERDAVRFIRPQRTSADMVVHFFWDEAVSKAAGAAFGVRLVQRHRATRLDLTEALGAFQQQPATVRQQFGVQDDDGNQADMIELDASLTSADAAALEAYIWREMPELPPLPPKQIGQVHVGRELRRSPTLALVQLLVAHQLVQAGKA